MTTNPALLWLFLLCSVRTKGLSRSFVTSSPFRGVLTSSRPEGVFPGRRRPYGRRGDHSVRADLGEDGHGQLGTSSAGLAESGALSLERFVVPQQDRDGCGGLIAHRQSAGILLSGSPGRNQTFVAIPDSKIAGRRPRWAISSPSVLGRRGDGPPEFHRGPGLG